MNPNMALKVWAYSQAIFCFAAKKRGHNRSVHVQVMLHAALGRPNLHLFSSIVSVGHSLDPVLVVTCVFDWTVREKNKRV